MEINIYCKEEKTTQRSVTKIRINGNKMKRSYKSNITYNEEHHMCCGNFEKVGLTYWAAQFRSRGEANR